MKMNLYKVMPLCMLLSLGACSSDEEIFEENNGVEVPSQGEFKTLRFSLGSIEGGMELDNGKEGRLLADWEAGWAPVNEAGAEFSPSQAYPLKKVYALIKPGESLNDWSDAKGNDLKVLEYDIVEAQIDGKTQLCIEILYNAKNNIVTLSDAHGHCYTSDAKGFNMIFTSQKDNIYTLATHPNLKTPNNKTVWAPAGDNLFRSVEFNLKAIGDKFEFVDVDAENGADPLKTNPLIMHRGTCSFNSKLIITDYGFPLDASSGLDKPQDGNNHCCFEKIIWKLLHHKGCWEDFDWDDLEIFDIDFEDGKFEIDWDDFADDAKEMASAERFAQYRRENPNFKDTETVGNCTIKDFLQKTNSRSQTEIKNNFLEELFAGVETVNGKRCLGWFDFVQRIGELKKKFEDIFNKAEGEVFEDLSKWTISTYIAPNRTHTDKMPYPHTFDFFRTDIRKYAAYGKAIFNEEGEDAGNGIVALTKAPRNLVDDVRFAGKPINHPVKSEYKGIGKDFNFNVSPFVFPFYIDGRYDLCFSIKQDLGNGKIKSGTLRFPIENIEYDEFGNPTVRETNFMTAGNSIFKTIILDVDDFAAKWNAKVAPRSVRGVFDNVVDLEENVLDVKYEML